MAIEDVSIYNYLREEEVLYKSEVIQRFLAEIVAQGYRLIASSEQKAFFQVWWRSLFGTAEGAAPLTEAAARIDPETIFTPGISPVLQSELDIYVREKRDAVSFKAYSTARKGLLRGLEFSLALEPKEGQVYASIEDRYFTLEDLQKGFRVFEHWLEIIEILYHVWHPIYAYSFDYSGEWPDTTREDALTLDVHWLYDITIFGPEIVDMLGRERVLTTPAWRVQVLDDGGVLLIPALYYGPGDSHDRETAAEHLGLPV